MTEQNQDGDVVDVDMDESFDPPSSGIVDPEAIAAAVAAYLAEHPIDATNDRIRCVFALDEATGFGGPFDPETDPLPPFGIPADIPIVTYVSGDIPNPFGVGPTIPGVVGMRLWTSAGADELLVDPVDILVVENLGSEVVANLTGNAQLGETWTIVNSQSVMYAVSNSEMVLRQVETMIEEAAPDLSDYATAEALSSEASARGSADSALASAIDGKQNAGDYPTSTEMADADTAVLADVNERRPPTLITVNFIIDCQGETLVVDGTEETPHPGLAGAVDGDSVWLMHTAGEYTGLWRYRYDSETDTPWERPSQMTDSPEGVAIESGGFPIPRADANHKVLWTDIANGEHALLTASGGPFANCLFRFGPYAGNWSTVPARIPRITRTIDDDSDFAEGTLYLNGYQEILELNYGPTMLHLPDPNNVVDRATLTIVAADGVSVSFDPYVSNPLVDGATGPTFTGPASMELTKISGAWRMTVPPTLTQQGIAAAIAAGATPAPGYQVNGASIPDYCTRYTADTSSGDVTTAITATNKFPVLVTNAGANDIIVNQAPANTLIATVATGEAWFVWYDGVSFGAQQLGA